MSISLDEQLRPSINIIQGITTHFRMRISSWFMSIVLLNVGSVLLLNPDIFVRPFYQHLSHWATQGQWGIACLVIAVIRLLCLTINGSIPGVKWTPYVRAVAAALSSIFWAQIVLAVMLDGKPGIGMATYPMLMLLEIYNTFLAMLDVDKVRRI